MSNIAKYTRPLLFAAAAVLLFSFFTQDRTPESTDDVILSGDEKFSLGEVVTLDIYNNSEKAIAFEYDCVQNPLDVSRYENGEWVLREATVDDLECSGDQIKIKAGESYLLSYAPWNFELFDEKGRYRIDLSLEVGEDEKTYTKEIEVKSRSIWGAFWQEAFYKPILNTLVYIVSVLPGHGLAWAVIILTLIIRLILLVPYQKSLKAQKNMQKLQPQLEAVKKKYEKEPQRMATETMALYKKHKVSPFSSCLPLIIQIPILFALFYVVKDGIALINPQLLYAGLQGFDASIINPNFLGLIDVTKVDPIVIPILIGGLQFIQFKMSLGRTLKTQQSNPTAMMMSKSMMYVMPVMIAFFAAAIPAVVSFYWGTSTLFMIVQHFFVNRSKD